MAQIVGIGANVFDTLYRLSTYPAEDTKQKAQSVKESGGGPCGTGLVAAAKLGASCAYIGNCSDDGAGRFLRSDFEKYNVSTEFMHSVDNTSAFCSCIWLCDDTASRTCVFNRGTVPPTTLGEREVDVISKAQVLMVDGNDLGAAIAGAEIARSNQTKVLYDAGGLYDGVERLLELTDILIPSEEFALGHTGAENVADAARMLWKMYAPEVIVITQGKEGGIMYDGKDILRYPAFPVEVLDSNGSGDVFHGAFAFGLSCGFEYAKCCVFSSAVSAIKCTHIGARQGVPDFDTTIKFLKSRGIEF